VVRIMVLFSMTTSLACKMGFIMDLRVRIDRYTLYKY
jgi:hypothetical protein